MSDGTVRIVVVLVIVAIIVIVARAFIIQPRSKNNKTNNVIPMSRYSGKNKKKSGQKCSMCGKSAMRISFYADEAGKVVGVCDSCKPHAERRDLSRL